MRTQEEIENSKIKLAESYARLLKNRDYKLVINNGFLDDGFNYLGRNITRVKPEYQDDVVFEIKARSVFTKYVDSIEEDARSILESREM